MARDSKIEKLVAAEAEGKGIIEDARAEAKRIKDEAASKIEVQKTDADEYIDGLRREREKKLADDLERERAESQQRVDGVLTDMAKRIDDNKGAAVDAVVREILKK